MNRYPLRYPELHVAKITILVDGFVYGIEASHAEVKV